MKTGMVFGVFDGLHEGHQRFLTEALSRADELVIVLTLDKTAEALKGRLPKRAFLERRAALEAFLPAARVIPGDTELGSWKILTREEPDIVLLGYDQSGIAEELKRLNIPFETLSSHEPERFKSGLLDRP